MGIRRRYARSAVVMLSVFGVATAGLAAASGAAGASVGSDQTDIAHLQQQIDAEGAHAQSLVAKFNEVQARVDSLDAQIAHDQKEVAADQAAQNAAMDSLRRVAVKAYVSGGSMESSPLALIGTSSNLTTEFEQHQYLGAVGNKLDSALTTVQLDQSRTQDAQKGLRAAQGDATKTLRELASARDASTAAIAADEAKLTHVTGDLHALLAAAAAREAAQEAAQERALAAAQQAAETPALSPAAVTAPSSSSTPSSTPPTSPLPPPTPTPASSGYANPLRGATALTPERIDQGVDYAGFGPVYAIGDGVVLSTVGPGWPDGTFIAYRLTDGPANGLVVYVAEDIQSDVQVGQTVNNATVLGQMFAGPSGIETGWADGSRLPDTMARRYGQFDGSNSTAFGINFSRFLQSLGAPGGVQDGASGVLPPGWPQW